MKLVGAVRFELTTSWTRTKRATSLRYAPTIGFENHAMRERNCNVKFISHRNDLARQDAKMCRRRPLPKPTATDQ